MPNTPLSALEGKTLVAKFGGSMALNAAVEEGFLKDCAALQKAGMKVAIVHGGGKRVSEVMKALGLEPKFVGGHRVTSEENLAVVEWVLSAEANKKMVASLQKKGVKAVGISGRDANLFIAKSLSGPGDFTGNIRQVNPDLVLDLWDKGYLPVISPVSASKEGHAFNVNADIAAGHLAAALAADHLVFVTDVPGVYEDLKRPETLFKTLSVGTIRRLMKKGVIEAGMIPKLEGAVKGLGQGRTEVRLVGGPEPGLLKKALQQPELGTRLVV